MRDVPTCCPEDGIPGRSPAHITPPHELARPTATHLARLLAQNGSTVSHCPGDGR